MQKLFKALIKAAVGASSPKASTNEKARVALQPPTKIKGATESYELVGEASYQDALDRLAGPKGEDAVYLDCSATLIEEPNNPHDKNAVYCLISGLKVGYISRDENLAIKAIIRKRGSNGQLNVNAQIRGGWNRGRNDKGNYGVRIQVPK
jgi:hypothetical protein